MEIQKYSRKNFLQSSIILSGTVFWGDLSCSSSEVKIVNEVRFQNLNEVLAEVERLEKSKEILTTGAWDVSQIMQHCAQSIDFSLTGFPIVKPYLFRKTIGKLVSSYFLSKGTMSHNLNDPIPGAPELVSSTDFKKGLAILKKSIHSFWEYKGELKMHFVYGEASREDYEKFHAMHIANHFSALQIIG
jgi:hypothetical protein